MTADSFQRFNSGSHLNSLAKQLDNRRSLDQFSSERTDRLITYKKNRTFFSPEIMFQMVPDSARLTHPGSGYNDFWSAVKIDQFGIITRHRKLQPRKHKRVNPLIHQFHCLFIKTISLILCKHTGCLNRKRTVHIHIKVREITQQILLFDLTDKIQ